MSTTETRLEVLTRERAQLALQVEEGDAAAAARLEAIERELADRALLTQRRELAAEERERRQAEEVARNEAEKRENAVADLRALGSMRLMIGKAWDEHADALVACID